MLIPERIENTVNPIVANKLGFPLSVVERVNVFQFKIVNEALEYFRSIEITGLGRITTKDKIVNKNITRYEEYILLEDKKIQATDDEKTIIRAKKRKESYLAKIEFLKRKLDD